MNDYIINHFGDKIEVSDISAAWFEAFTNQGSPFIMTQYPDRYENLPEAKRITVGAYYKDCLHKVAALLEIRKEYTLPIEYINAPFPSGNPHFRLGKHCSFLKKDKMVYVYVYPTDKPIVEPIK